MSPERDQRGEEAKFKGAHQGNQKRIKRDRVKGR